MDLNYFKYENNIQVYYGILKNKVKLVEEKNKEEITHNPDTNDLILDSENIIKLSIC